MVTNLINLISQRKRGTSSTRPKSRISQSKNEITLAGKRDCNANGIGRRSKEAATLLHAPARELHAFSFRSSDFRLLREAQESGATIVTGLEMFIGQAYEQFERFTGLPAPKELFKQFISNLQ
ncbi:hypothetical protein VitviT2T_006388 [Vitis vinifera]|uniref:SDH C-terminal domain-containing protein n=1 Tax=Vitis vinifera TaxID=29760 RepID=A0ABY9BWW3_VITVI|nr:hypothetical protein VitviT2T_006388 [Vitis vinifera]